MLIEGTELLNNKVRSLIDNENLGRIKTLIIDPEKGRLLAVLVAKGNFGPRKFLSILDMIDFNLDTVFVRNSDVLMKREELVRANEILIKKIQILKIKAFTKKGDYLGKVDDVLIDTNTGMIEKFYIGHSFLVNLWSKGIIVPKNKVLKITKDKLIVSNEVSEGTKEKATEKALA